MKNLEPNSVRFEIRNYPKDTNEQLIAVLVIFLYGFGLLFFFIEVDDKIISINSVLLGSSILIIGYLYKFFFKRPKLDGEILIASDSVIFNRTEIPIENIDYISINYKDFRGRIIPKRREIPLPRFGTNN